MPSENILKVIVFFLTLYTCFFVSTFSNWNFELLLKIKIKLKQIQMFKGVKRSPNLTLTFAKRKFKVATVSSELGYHLTNCSNTSRGTLQ